MMKPNHIKLSFQFSQAQVHLYVARTLFILITLNQFILTHQYNNNYDTNLHSPQSSALDEEITVHGQQHQNDVETDISPTQNAHQIVHSSINGIASGLDEKQLEKQTSSVNINDPFAVTFEDYLKEASQISAHHIPDDVDQENLPSFAAIPDKAGLIADEEDSKHSNVKQRSYSLIDYIFPPSTNAKNTEQETLPISQPKSHDTQVQQSEINQELNLTTNHELLDKIRLLFAWKQFPTNKCSKTCGKGFRVNYLSCVDLKYNVRVEDVLCSKSNLPKPREISEEPCNEIDCAPQWETVQFQECSQASLSQEGICHTNLYKRAQCLMINKHGITVHLEDSKCNSTLKPTTPQHDASKEESPVSSKSSENSLDVKEEEEGRVPELESKVSKPRFDYSMDEYIEKNDILSNIYPTTFTHDSPKYSDSRPTDEPVFEIGSWSECDAAMCGQLGKRIRDVVCRLYLSRSSRLTELPDSSCHGLTVPHRQEPCYKDCVQENDNLSNDHNNNNSTQEFYFNEGDNTDETVYDSELARYIWRKDGYTKCNAECLGGHRESIFACWDKVGEHLVESYLCDPELKPKSSLETCNEISCPPEWKIEPFSECSKPCGSTGIRTRSIVCVQQVPIQSGRSSYLVVPDELCSQTNSSIAHKSEPCNRKDCRPEWNVSPWSECSEKCGHGTRNRTVICVQEFATKQGPTGLKKPNAELLEAVTISSYNWHPGKVTQVPFQECYDEYRMVPTLDEKCFTPCTEYERFIDADSNQNYRMTPEASKRKTITVKIGGRADVLEGRNLKIRCKVMAIRDGHHVHDRVSEPVEWFKDGIKIFNNRSKIAEKQYTNDDNLIFSNGFTDDKNQLMADEPRPLKVSDRVERSSSADNIRSKIRNLKIRSWDQSSFTTDRTFHFIYQVGGRFSLGRENTLRIRNLRFHDSGLYTCSYGSTKETLQLRVVSREELVGDGTKPVDNYGA